MSTIVWTNRGQTSDGFAAVFGTSAASARSVIDADITSWEREIINFNYPGGGNTYNMTISTAVANTGQGAGTVVDSYASNGSPESATIDVLSGTDGHGGGYFLDPNPLASTAFVGAGSATNNAYAAYAPSTSPAYGKGDLYELVLHEMGHAMGIVPNAKTEKYSFNTNVVDTADSALGGVNPAVGHYWAFKGPDGNLLVTDFNDLGNNKAEEESGPVHYAAAGAQVTSGGVTYYGSDDLLVPYYSYGQRRQISRDDLIFLEDSYGYTVQTADYYGTAYDELDSNGELHISVPGGGGNVISLTSSGGNLTVNMTLGSPVVGADPSSITSVFAAGSVTSIDIVGGPGNDTIGLNSLGGSVPVSIVGGGGNDTVTLINSGPSTYMYTNQVTGSNVDVVSMTGITTLNVDGSASNNYYEIDSSPVVAGGQINIEGSNANDTFDYGGPGGLTAMPSIHFDGFGGANSVSIDNTDATGSWQYFMTDTQVTSYGPSSYERIDTFSSVPTVTLYGGGTGDTYSILYTAAADHVTVVSAVYSRNDIFYADEDYGTLDVIGQPDDTVFDQDSIAASYNVNSYGVVDSVLTLNALDISKLWLESSNNSDTTTIYSLPTFSVELDQGIGTNTVGIAAPYLLPSFAYGLTVAGNADGSTTLAHNNGGNSSTTTRTVTTITANTFSIGSGNLTYTQIAALTCLQAYLGTANVIGTNPQTAYTFNGNYSAVVNIGDGNVSNVETGNTPIEVVTGDVVNVSDESDSTGRTYDVTGGSIVVPGQFEVDYAPAVLGANLQAGAGADIINFIGDSDKQMSVNGGLGNDSFFIGLMTQGLINQFGSFAGLDPVTVAGGGGVDSLTIYDPEEDALPISATEIGPIVQNAYDSAQIFYSGFAGIAITHGDAGAGGSVTVSSTAAGTPVTLTNAAGNDPIAVITTDPTAPVTIAPNAGVDAVSVGPTGTTTGTAVADFSATQSIGTLTLYNGGTAVVTASTRKVLTVSGLAITGNGTLDLTRNDLVVQGGSIATVTSEVTSGFNLTGGGNWNGTGITSSAAASDTTHTTALGAIVNNNGTGNVLFNTANPFDGVVPSLNDVLVKYTYYGDANLDGKVDGSDYSLLDSGYAADQPNHGSGPATGWFNGDFNYDKSIDGSDYSLIDNAFDSQGGHLVSPAAEPAAMVATGIAPAPTSPAANRPAPAPLPSPGRSPVARPVAVSRSVFTDTAIPTNLLDDSPFDVLTIATGLLGKKRISTMLDQAVFGLSAAEAG